MDAQQPDHDAESTGMPSVIAVFGLALLAFTGVNSWNAGQIQQRNADELREIRSQNSAIHQAITEMAARKR